MLTTITYTIAVLAVLFVVGWLLCEFLAVSSDADGSEMRRERDGWDE